MSFLKKRPRSPAEMSDEQLRGALGNACIKANRRIVKKEVVYGTYGPSTTEIDAIAAARRALRAGDRRPAIDLLTRS